jgi:hypothetical protein
MVTDIHICQTTSILQNYQLKNSNFTFFKQDLLNVFLSLLIYKVHTTKEIALMSKTKYFLFYFENRSNNIFGIKNTIFEEIYKFGEIIKNSDFKTIFFKRTIVVK